MTSLRSVQAVSGLLLRRPLLSARCAMAFTDGVAIGSKAFIENVFKERREHFGPKRKDGARPIVEAETDVCTLRALRVQAVE